MQACECVLWVGEGQAGFLMCLPPPASPHQASPYREKGPNLPAPEETGKSLVEH